MNSAVNTVAMGARGVAMTGVFLVIVLALLVGGLIAYMQARRRNAQDGTRGSGSAE